MPGEEFNEAVEPGLDRGQRRGFSNRLRGDDGLPGRDPTLDLVELAGAAEGDQDSGAFQE